MAQNIRMFLGAPQTDKLQVRTVQTGYREEITQIIITNTSDSEGKFTLTVNTTDVIKDFEIAVGETKILDVNIVLDSGDTFYVQQATKNQLNVVVTGSRDLANIV